MKHDLHKFAPQILIIFLSMMPFAKVIANESEAIRVVEDLHMILLNNMKNAERLGYQGRFNALSSTIEQNFDFPLISKVILSRHWKQLGQEKQALFTEQLSDLTKTTYAARFSSFEGESFSTLGVEQLKKGRLLVKTEIQSEEETVSLSYLMHPVENQWKIISVIANGVNDLSLKRAEYSTIIREKGFDALVEQIAIKIKEHENF